MVNTDARPVTTGVAECFAGRERELTLFTTLLEGLPRDGVRVLAVSGAPGMGKTALLGQFARAAADAGVPHVVAPYGTSFEDALGRLDVMDGIRVLMLDGYDAARADRDGEFEAPPGTLVVIASTQPLPESDAPAGLRQAQWRRVSLRPLSREAALRYLELRGVPLAQRGAIQHFADGWPLPLNTFASRALEEADWSFDARYELPAIRDLAVRLQPPAPSAEHQRALDVATVCHTAHEDVLAELLEMADTEAIFDWLARLPYMRSQSDGLFMEGYARNVLDRNLGWRRPDHRVELVRQARLYYWNRFRTQRGHAMERSLVSLQFLQRVAQIPIGAWDIDDLTATPLRPSDVDSLVGLVRTYEGDESAAIAAYWLERQPEGVTVVRGRDGQPTGFLSMIALRETTPEDVARDPGVAAARCFVDAALPLGQEQAALVRFSMSADAYDDFSPTHRLLVARTHLHWTRGGLAYSLVTHPDPAKREEWLRQYGFLRVPEADFTIGGRRYALFGHDWRAVPVPDWFESISFLPATDLASVWQNRARVVFDEDAYRHSVHEALVDFQNTAALRANPLLRSRTLLERVPAGASVNERVEALRALMSDAIDHVPNSRNVLRAADLLRWTYVEPQGTQRQTAQLLNLPFSTYRNHLTRAHEILARQMWAQEAALTAYGGSANLT